MWLPLRASLWLPLRASLWLPLCALCPCGPLWLPLWASLRLPLWASLRLPLWASLRPPIWASLWLPLRARPPGYPAPAAIRNWRFAWFRRGTGSHPGRLVLLRVIGAIVPDILTAIRGGVSAGGVPRSTLLPGYAARLLGCLFVECLLGDAEGVDRSRHTSVEHHLGDDFGDLLLGYADVEGAGYVPLDHLWTVAKHHQCGNGAQAAGA